DRMAEVREEPVAEELRDVAAEALDGLLSAPLVLRAEPVPVLRVEARCELRRADHVAEEHGEVPSFAHRGVRRRVETLALVGNQAVTAGAAEPCVGGVRMPAAGAAPLEPVAACAAEAR